MSGRFHDTRWTLVVRSHGRDAPARLALSELCETYYGPVVAFLRHEGRTEDAARELTHDFFARLLEGDEIRGADPARGRFRNFLLGALKHFAAGQRDRHLAMKRGGGQTHQSLHPADTSTAPGSETAAGVQIADLSAESPDAAFDRQWALIVLAQALKRLEQEMGDAGKGESLVILKPWLTGERQTCSQAGAAEALGISLEAVKVAIHRLRKRFRDAVKAEIAQTVTDSGKVQEELGALMAALRSPSPSRPAAVF